MIVEGVWLAVVGMFTVFAFLTLLVALVHFAAAFFEANAHRFPEPAPAEGAGRPGSDDAELAVVVALAEALRRGQRV